MRYFLFDQWAGEAEWDETAIPRYEAYLATIRDELPASVRRFAEEHNLHDAELRELAVDLAARTVRCRFDGYDRQGWERRQYELVYEGVAHLGTAAPPPRPLGGPGGFGAFGYDELEWLGDEFGGGLIEHRMLYSTGVELVIRFRDLAFRFADGGPDTELP